MDPYLYSQLNFFQLCQDNSVGEKIVFSTNDLEKLDIHIKNNVNPHLQSYGKINSIWITNLNAKMKIIELLKENTRENFCDLGHRQEFLKTKPTNYKKNCKTNHKLHFIEINISCVLKDTTKEKEKGSHSWKKMFI